MTHTAITVAMAAAQITITIGLTQPQREAIPGDP